MKLVSKYHNKIIIYDGIKFDSIKEKNRYIELKTDEFAILLDGLIQACEEQGINTLSPNEILRDKVYEIDN